MYVYIHMRGNDVRISPELVISVAYPHSGSRFKVCEMVPMPSLQPSRIGSFRRSLNGLYLENRAKEVLSSFPK
jgi:hypothetical protein